MDPTAVLDRLPDDGLDSSSVRLCSIHVRGIVLSGKVIAITDNGLTIRSMAKCKKHGWRWAERNDEGLYTWDDVEKNTWEVYHCNQQPRHVQNQG